MKHFHKKVLAAPFASLHRLREMTAVCLETPVGYPQMSVSW